MKICITGASGFIGQHVLKALSDTDCAILAPSRNELDLSGVDHVEDYMRLHQPTHLIHLAWYAEHGKFWNAQENFDWVIHTSFLLKAFHKHGGKRIVCAGTCAEYDWSSTKVFSEKATMLSPSSVYGQCKDVTRRFVQSYCEANRLSWAWGRIFFPYGPGEPQSKLIPSLFQAMQGRIEPFGINHNAKRDFIYIEDLAEAFKALILTTENGIYNICLGRAVPLKTIVKKTAKIFKEDPEKILKLTAQKPDPYPTIVGDNSRLKSLGWSPRFTLDDGLSRYAALT